VRKRIKEIRNEDPTNIKNLKTKLFEVPSFKNFFEKIKKEWENAKENIDYSFEFTYNSDVEMTEIFPPCIKEIVQKLQNGVNLSHTERLYLVFFLHALEYPLEKIIDLFSVLPDFDRDKTEYQVKFAKRKEYSPHSCSKLKSLNLCKAEKYKDELCLEGYYSKKKDKERKIQHPLFYIQIKQYRLNRKVNKREDV
jgi:DNA primase large subunit